VGHLGLTGLIASLCFDHLKLGQGTGSPESQVNLSGQVEFYIFDHCCCCYCYYCYHNHNKLLLSLLLPPPPPPPPPPLLILLLFLFLLTSSSLKKNKNRELDLKDKIENYKNFDKPRKTIKKTNEEGLNYLICWIKLKVIKTLTKEQRKKKLKVEEPNKKILYIQIRN
jgi:hypothetical protein